MLYIGYGLIVIGFALFKLLPVRADAEDYGIVCGYIGLLLMLTYALLTAYREWK